MTWDQQLQRPPSINKSDSLIFFFCSIKGRLYFKKYNLWCPECKSVAAQLTLAVRTGIWKCFCLLISLFTSLFSPYVDRFFFSRPDFIVNAALVLSFLLISPYYYKCKPRAMHCVKGPAGIPGMLFWLKQRATLILPSDLIASQGALLLYDQRPVSLIFYFLTVRQKYGNLVWAECALASLGSTWIQVKCFDVVIRP